MDDSTEIGMTRYQLIRLIDPYNRNPSLLSKTNEQLLKNLFDLCMSKKAYEFDDYRIEKKCILEYVTMKDEEIKERDKELRKREHEIKQREERIKRKEEEFKRNLESKKHTESKRITAEATPVMVPTSMPTSSQNSNYSDYSDYVRDPIPVVRECLIPPRMEDVIYYSQQSEAKRYNQELNTKSKEEKDMAEAIKQSLEEQERRIANSVIMHNSEKKETKEEKKQEKKQETKQEKKEGPNYEKLRQKTVEFTPEVVDRLYEILKNKRFSEFHGELAKLPVQITSCIWKLQGPDGSSLKQLVQREGDAYKCLE